uniref:Uncharacterized protein n=1 Tax=Avena sativa TaxID=4498 RepID=A0ACD5ZWS0_AVESA
MGQPLDVDDLLSEILLRLPPQPSSLPRASLVCSRWRSLVSDRSFVRRFRLRHRRNPPLLGCFVRTFDEFYFEPTMGPPDCVPRGRFSPQSLRGDVFRPLGCRHGLVLTYNWSQLQVVVWDPVNDAQHHIDLPPGFDILEVPIHIQGAVLRSATDVQHFQVILVGLENRRVNARVYSSETGGWGGFISTPLPPGVSSILYIGKPSVLVGDSLYWLIAGDFVRIFEFDLERQRLAVIAVPMDMHVRKSFQCSVMRADDGGLGFLFLSDFSAQLWNRKTDCDGAASWVLGRTIELDSLVTLNLHKEMAPLKIIGFAEENNVVFLLTGLGVFMIHLDSLQSKKISETNSHCIYHPFESVYTADTSIGGGRDGAELLHST